MGIWFLEFADKAVDKAGYPYRIFIVTAIIVRAGRQGNEYFLRKDLFIKGPGADIRGREGEPETADNAPQAAEITSADF